ncbi:TonB-dependent receptor [Terriglobus roseus]|uniref:Iron complex outermembrane recepter protein n=1 Tax=Terriglobus roseus TaxID=392734 RepID=A0A1H4N066_9BACT|nr:TonB-dependent receptor [Terriglobus roseus]SEB88686.1 iron complex outermembrane recepter protein [Terriglobus roseus]
MFQTLMYASRLRPAGCGKASLAVAAVLLASCAAAAQTAQVAGTVRATDHSAVSGAGVTLSNAARTSFRTMTDDAGQYTLPGVTPGSYTLVVTKAGFAASTTQVVVGPNGRSAAMDVSLALEGGNTSVTVTAGISGTAANGYNVANVEQGVLGSAPIVDQPFTIAVMPADLIQNTQVKSLRDAFTFLPLVTFTEQQGSEILRPATRGVQGSIAQNTRIDGMAMAVTGANPMEQYQELQVQSGLGAALYGPANPSGMFDFVLKRPTESRTTNLYLEQDSSSIGTVYVDAGGRLGPHKIFGYRTNLLFGDGTAFVDKSRLRRRLAEFAPDLRITNRTTLDAHYSAYDVVQRGYPGWFSYGADPTDTTSTAQRPKRTLLLPDAPDPTRPGYGQPYAGVNLTTQSASTRLLHDVSPNWHAMMGGTAQRLDRFIDTPVNTLTNNTGSYSTSLASGFAPRFGVESDLGYITGVLNKWKIHQDIVAASEGYRFNQYAYTAPAAASLVLGKASMGAPVLYAPPAAGLPQNKGLYQSAVVHQQGFNLGDFVMLPRGFGFRVATSQDWIGVDNYTATARTGGSNKNGISPSASVLYKPTSGTTVYATYASSLQQGDIAPVNATLVNSGQALAPYRSKEWETGFKSAMKPVTFTASLFRLQRPFAETVALNSTQNVYQIIGKQVNYGAELSGQGTLFHRILINGGFTALNARLNDTGIAATNGKRFVGIPGYKSNLYSEYRVPHVKALVITGDWQFVGRRPQDDENLHSTPGYDVYNLGFRYSRVFFDKLATLRFTTNNLSNTHYYSTIAAGDITGTNASANTAHFGAPRTIASSLQFAF